MKPGFYFSIPRTSKTWKSKEKVKGEPAHKMTVAPRLSCLISILALAFNISAYAEELPNVYDSDLSHAVYSEGPTTIPGLAWAGDDGKPAFSIEGMKNGKPSARMAGTFGGKNAGTLLFTSPVGIQKAKFTDDQGHFNVQIPLIGRKTPVKVQFIDDYGNLKSQDIEIVYENYYQFQLNESTKKKISLDTGASISYLDYAQTASGTNVKISEIGITPKIGTTINLSSKVDLGASAFLTLIPIPMTKTPDGTSTPRFYGINLRIGYKLLGLRTGNIYLMTGPYFWGMIVPPSDNGLNYGVLKLSGPQLFLVGRFLNHAGRTFVGYIKGASILDGDGGMSQNHEFAIGAAYQITGHKEKRRLMLNLDIARAAFVVQGESITLNSYSLGISTSF